MPRTRGCGRGGCRRAEGRDHGGGGLHRIRLGGRGLRGVRSAFHARRGRLLTYLQGTCLDTVHLFRSQGEMVAAPWSQSHGLEPVLSRWLESRWVRPCLMADHVLERTQTHAVPFPSTLAEPIARALRGRGIVSLYRHQATACELAREKRNFVVATPTASGKSLCFHLPVLQALLDDPDARAVYLYPTKAL